MFEIEGSIRRPPLAPTFELPSRDGLLKVRCGDDVMLIFAGEPGERMWVEVTEQPSPHEWCGRLRNAPRFIESLEYDATIRFHPLDIISVRYQSQSEKADA
jgi:hypothetical protein